MEEIRVKATKEGMKTVLRELERSMEKSHCPDKEKMECLIALEELIVNIVHYAYEPEEGEMQIFYEIVQQTDDVQRKNAAPIKKESAEKGTVSKAKADRVHKKIKVILRDQGKAYNPLKRKDPDITLAANRRKVGGLGIFMAKNLLDGLSYERKEESNVLYLEKCFTSF